MPLIGITFDFVLMTFSLMVIGAEAAIPSPPSIIKQPPQEKYYGILPFTLRCEATGDPEPTYTWKKDGLDFKGAEYHMQINQQNGRGDLVFIKPKGNDEGFYQCFVENIHGTAISNGVFLRPLDLDSVPQPEPQVVTVEEGQLLTLD